MYFCWFKHISPAFANIMLGVVFIMIYVEVIFWSNDIKDIDIVLPLK